MERALKKAIGTIALQTTYDRDDRDDRITNDLGPRRLHGRKSIVPIEMHLASVLGNIVRARVLGSPAMPIPACRLECVRTLCDRSAWYSC